MAKARLALKVSPRSDHITFNKVKSKISQGRRANYTSMCSLLRSLKQKLYKRSTKSPSQNLLGFQVFIITPRHHLYPVSPEWKSWCYLFYKSHLSQLQKFKENLENIHTYICTFTCFTCQETKIMNNITTQVEH